MAKIYHLLRGRLLPDVFKTNSLEYVPTGFPPNREFIKHYDASQIWVNLVLDFCNDMPGATNYIQIRIDGEGMGLNYSTAVVNADELKCFSFFAIFHPETFNQPYPKSRCAGKHTIDIYVSVYNGMGKYAGVGTFKTDLAQLDVYEILLDEPELISKSLPKISG